MSAESLIGGRYRLLDQLGSGGMGQVWTATDLRLGGKVVAIKRLPEFDAAGSARNNDIEIFEREAHVASRLRHPNIVSITDFFIDGGAPFIVMEYVEGRTLRDLLDEGPLGIVSAQAVAEQLCNALAAVHAAGLIHRDVKPSNVIVDRYRTVKLVDFGIARLSEDAGHTRTGLLKGTVAYLPPEAFEGAPATKLGDMWALGATVYEIVRGRAAFDGPTQTAVMAAVVTKDVPALTSGTWLDPLVAGLLRRNPAERLDAEGALHLIASAQANDASHTRIVEMGKWEAAEAAVAAPLGPYENRWDESANSGLAPVEGPAYTEGPAHTGGPGYVAGSGYAKGPGYAKGSGYAEGPAYVDVAPMHPPPPDRRGWLIGAAVTAVLLGTAGFFVGRGSAPDAAAQQTVTDASTVTSTTTTTTTAAATTVTVTSARVVAAPVTTAGNDPGGAAAGRWDIRRVSARLYDGTLTVWVALAERAHPSDNTHILIRGRGDSPRKCKPSFYQAQYGVRDDLRLGRGTSWSLSRYGRTGCGDPRFITTLSGSVTGTTYKVSVDVSDLVSRSPLRLWVATFRPDRSFADSGPNNGTPLVIGS